MLQFWAEKAEKIFPNHDVVLHLKVRNCIFCVCYLVAMLHVISSRLLCSHYRDFGIDALHVALISSVFNSLVGNLTHMHLRLRFGRFPLCHVNLLNLLTSLHNVLF